MKFKPPPWMKKIISEGYFTEKQLVEKLNYYGLKCWICGWRKMYGIDHVIPKTYREIKHLSNFKPVCHPCNSIKNSQYPFDIEMLKARVSRPELSDIEKLKIMAQIALRNCEIRQRINNRGKKVRTFAAKGEIIINDVRMLAKAVLELL